MRKRMKNNRKLKETSITDLHESLMISILTFLPLQFIIRCSCVCKSWASLIVKPYFMESYYSSGRAPVPFLIEDRSNLIKPNNLFLAQLDQASCTTINSPPGPLIPRKFRFSLKFLDDLYPNPCSYSLRVLTTCRVTGCIAAYAFKDPKIDRSKHPCHIFNPLTGQHILVERSKTTSGKGYPLEHSCALVFAEKTNQLKLLLFIPLKTEKVRVEIQTIGTNSWRRIGKIPFIPYNQAFPAYANGLYHWIGITHVIYSFNAEEEVFEEIQTPPCIKTFSHSYLGVLSGCLCIFMESTIMEFWVMNVDGNRKSWTKKLIIDNERICFYKILEPLKCLENGEIAMLCRRFKAICYNPRTGRYKRIKFAGKDSPQASCVPFPYIPSLRSVLPTRSVLPA